MSKAEEFQKAAEEEERKFRETYLKGDEAEPVPAEPTPVEATAVEPPVVAPETTQEAPNEPDPTPAYAEEMKVVDESKYKAAVKAMNEAQRKAAEAVKREEEFQKREAELEAKLKELSAPKPPQRVEEPEDDLETDLPEVVKIAERKARRAIAPLEEQVAELRKALKEERESRSRAAAEDASAKMLTQIKTAHPDYDDVIQSDEMVAWINNEAPPIYKAIYEGSIPFQARDAIAVLDAYKHTLTPVTAKASKTSPSAAEIAAPVRTNTQIAPKANVTEPPTAKEMDWFMHNSHKLSQAELAEWDRRLSAL